MLREFKESDAKEILKWIKSEREFRMWSADRYESYPIVPEDINKNYSKEENFYPMTLVENEKIIGHLILRNPDGNKDVIRLGFIIVDSNIRGKGYGKKIILEAIKYAKNELGAKEINLGVFTNNKSALECYKAVGFKIIDIKENTLEFYDEKWDCAEMILE